MKDVEAIRHNFKANYTQYLLVSKLRFGLSLSNQPAVDYVSTVVE